MKAAAHPSGCHDGNCTIDPTILQGLGGLRPLVDVHSGWLAGNILDKMNDPALRNWSGLPAGREHFRHAPGADERKERDVDE